MSFPDETESKMIQLVSRAERAETRVAELEAIVAGALSTFECTQRPANYPADHWSNRAIRALKR